MIHFNDAKALKALVSPLLATVGRGSVTVTVTDAQITARVMDPGHVMLTDLVLDLKDLAAETSVRDLLPGEYVIDGETAQRMLIYYSKGSVELSVHDGRLKASSPYIGAWTVSLLADPQPLPKVPDISLPASCEIDPADLKAICGAAETVGTDRIRLVLSSDGLVLSVSSDTQTVTRQALVHTYGLDGTVRRVTCAADYLKTLSGSLSGTVDLAVGTDLPLLVTSHCGHARSGTRTWLAPTVEAPDEAPGGA